jgi:RHS repeat-associated protein
MPFGEVRTEVGTISQTDFSFTGQRSISMLSIMDYIARNYDPAIGRFVQPDSIVPSAANPQSWNRYSYGFNNPSRFTDPSGHKACERQDENENCVPETPATLSPQGVGNGRYSPWEQGYLEDLIHSKSSDALHAVRYIFKNDVHLKPGNLPPGTGAAWQPGNTIIVDTNKKQNRTYKLSLIMHETVHLEQYNDFPLNPLTVAGELEAWQKGFQFYQDLAGSLPGDKYTQPIAASLMTLDYNSLSILDTEKAHRWMNQFSPGYRSEFLLPWNWIDILIFNNNTPLSTLFENK